MGVLFAGSIWRSHIRFRGLILGGNTAEDFCHSVACNCDFRLIGAGVWYAASRVQAVRRAPTGVL
jgi:hypothetical protein